MVWPVTASLAVAGQRTSSRLMTGPVFTFRAMGVPKNFIFSEAVDDARLVNVVRRHLEFDAIANGKSDKSFAHFSGNVREDKMFVGQSDPEHGAGKDGHDCSFQLESFFCVHNSRAGRPRKFSKPAATIVSDLPTIACERTLAAEWARTLFARARFTDTQGASV